MAAPHVTGALALVMEAAGRRLPIEETRRLILESVEAPASDSDLPRIGGGYLDVEAALERARALRTARPVKDTEGAAPSESVAEAETDTESETSTESEAESQEESVTEWMAAGSTDTEGDCGCRERGTGVGEVSMSTEVGESDAIETTESSERFSDRSALFLTALLASQPARGGTNITISSAGDPLASTLPGYGEALEAEAAEYLWHAESAAALPPTESTEGIWDDTRVLALIAAGRRDENDLTNQVLFARHPELGGRRLAAGDSALIREWLEIRDGTVRRLLRAATALSSPSAPSSSGSAAAGQVRSAGHSENALREAWAEYRSAESRMVEIRLLGWTTPVNPLTPHAWHALEAALTGAGYQATRAWVYNPRPIGDTGIMSFHGYGLALDIDEACNPNNPTPDHRAVRFSDAATQKERCADVRRRVADTSFTRDQITAVEDIHTVDGLRVFSWGGRWRSTKDSMHFQIALTPRELARGLSDGS